MTPDSGHVFVIHGALADVDYDAVIISTSHQFGVRQHWATTLGKPWTDLDEQTFRHRVREQLRPDDWTRTGWGRARSTTAGTARPTWFIDVAIDSPLTRTIHDVVDRLRPTLADIASNDVRAATGRARTLVALPVLGVGGGGFTHIAGEAIDAQLTACEESARTLGIDIAIVAASPSDYSAFQARRRALVEQGRLLSKMHPELDREARRIADEARHGKLALFIGAGVSIGAGLPSWTKLLEILETQASDRIAGIDTDELSLLDRAELLSAVLHPDELRETIRRSVRADRYGLPHSSLASLGCREVVTTNYDTLYEKAARFVSDRPISVLPFMPTHGDAPWVLKMHGDAEHDSELVLTRSDFVHYDTASRPMASLLQGLMVTKHLLIVGASLEDENFLRLALEVKRFRHRDIPEPVGTVVTLAPDRARELMWEDFFTFLPVGSSSGTTAENARALSIFLDRVAMLASHNRHVLDKRYAALLASDEERAAAEALRDAYEQHAAVIESSPAWKSIEMAMASAGVTSKGRFTSSGSPQPE